MSDRTRGLLYGVIASALWSSVFVAARYVTVIRGVDPYYTAALRFGSGAIVAVVYLLVAGKARGLLADRRDVGWMILLGGIGIFGMGELVFISSTLTSSINSALLLNANAVFILFSAAPRRRRTRRSTTCSVRWRPLVARSAGLCIRCWASGLCAGTVVPRLQPLRSFSAR